MFIKTIYKESIKYEFYQYMKANKIINFICSDVFICKYKNMLEIKVNIWTNSLIPQNIPNMAQIYKKYHTNISIKIIRYALTGWLKQIIEA